jgi:serine/threonine protein kinase
MENGTRLGPYEVQEQLGAGGMGEVWLASDTRLGRQVAIKTLPEEYASVPERLARFEQEARAAAALNHPHIAVVYDIGAAEGVHFIVQELLKGQPLQDVLAEGRMSLDRVLEFAVEVVEALAAAHAAGIVHRDLKPANLFVSPEGHAKVLDFGLAKLTEVALGSSPGDDRTKSPTMLGTAAGQVMGTAGYMAPEQVEGGDVDGRADVFSFGCVLYEMVTGRRPFAGRSVMQTLDMIVHESPEPLGETDAKLPTQLQWILDKCLAKDRTSAWRRTERVATREPPTSRWTCGGSPPTWNRVRRRLSCMRPPVSPRPPHRPRRRV